jgi:hypothetical protein
VQAPRAAGTQSCEMIVAASEAPVDALHLISRRRRQ